MREKSDSYTKLYGETAEKLGINKAIVKEVVEDYYAGIKQGMEDFTHDKFHVPKIGTFYVNCLYLKKKINRYERKLKRLRKESTIQQFIGYKERAEYLFNRYKGTWKNPGRLKKYFGQE